MSAKSKGKDEKARVLVVDDHPIVRQGIIQIISQEPDFTVCGEAESASAALQAIAALKPDVVLADLSLKESSGLELVKDVRVRWPDLPVLMLSMHDESIYAERVLRAGARGYLTKVEATERVIEALRMVLRGEIYLSSQMASRLVGMYVKGRPESTGSTVERLSDRELEVFNLIGQGLKTSQIAERLHLSVKTIESHRSNIKRKLNLDNATQLLQHAIQWTQYENTK